MTIVSTTSAANLAEFNTPLIAFSKALPDLPEIQFLRYPNRWFLGSRDGCSCAFRHLDHQNEGLGFSEPAEWWPEEDENIQATHEAFDIFEKILKQGNKLDCIDTWTYDDKSEPEIHGDFVVKLRSVGKKCFRFLEGKHVEFLD